MKTFNILFPAPNPALSDHLAEIFATLIKKGITLQINGRTFGTMWDIEEYLNPQKTRGPYPIDNTGAYVIITGGDKGKEIPFFLTTLDDFAWYEAVLKNDIEVTGEECQLSFVINQTARQQAALEIVLEKREQRLATQIAERKRNPLPTTEVTRFAVVM